MKKNITYLFLAIIAIMLLGSCSATEEDMSKVSADGQRCTPVKDILSKADPASGLDKKLTIYNDDTQQDEGIVTWLSNKVTSVVRTAGLKIYLKIALNLDFRFAVAIMMTLAVILFTASVILGLTQANGYNALMFVLKLIIIYQLSINYYYFDVYVIESFEGLVSDAMMFSSLTFSDYAAPTQMALCNGLIGAACNPMGILSSVFGLQAITDLVNLLGIGGGGQVVDLSRITLFGAIDEKLSDFFDFNYWKLILAVSVTGSTGFFWGLMMALLIISYFFAIILAVKTYLMATIARYVLYGLGPIFISFALFNQTRSLFDGWLQQLISFTLQPIFLFIFLGMFHTILAGFTQKLYVDLKGYITQMVYICDSTDTSPDCQTKTCTQGDFGCTETSPGTWEVRTKTIVNDDKGMCIKWDKINKDTNQYWYNLCDNVDNCRDNKGINPAIPVDIWTLISAIIICYLMGAMCHWVVDIANTLAGGAITLSDTKIQGWDRLKGQAKQGVNQMTSQLFKGGGGNGPGGGGATRGR